MNRIIRYIPFAILMLTLLYGCSSSELVNKWKDEEFIKENKFKRLFVIGLGQHPDKSKLFENLFKIKLEEENVEVVKSYPIIGTSKKLSKDEVLSIVTDLKADGVLITHLKDTAVEGTYSPNSPNMSGSNLGSMYTYYNSTYDYVSSSGSYQQKLKVYLETRLFDVKEERVVWSTVSETVDPNDIRAAIEEIQDLIVNQMKADEVF